MSICLIFDSQIVSRIYRMHNSNVNGGTAILVLVLINLDFHHLIIPIPHTLLEQKRIVSKIESIFAKIDAIENNVNKSLDYIDVLKKTVLKRGFEGKLVPQDPRDEPASILLEHISKAKAKVGQVNSIKKRKKNGK